jgi:nitroimidazol reductase NimA-like FMN-containing flavoprotein (pyridoxamine 5'-phosphate oxidase superfamily)
LQEETAGVPDPLPLGTAIGAGAFDYVKRSLVMNRENFLAQPRIAVLATVERDGAAYLTAIWFLWLDGAFLVPTAGESRKGKNAAARPRASILIDERGERFRGVFASGGLELIRGNRARTLNERIHRRYVTEQGMAEPQLGGLLAKGDDITIRLMPEWWRTWDLEPAFGDRLANPALVYPLGS